MSLRFVFLVPIAISLVGVGCGAHGLDEPRSTEHETLASTTDVNPTKDAFVRNGSYASTNFGTSSALVIKQSGTGYTRHSWLTFNVTAYTNVTSAKLRLYVDAVGAENANTVPADLYTSTVDNWGETTITWNNAPAAGAKVGSINVTTATAGTWIEYDVTSAVVADTDGLVTFEVLSGSQVNRSVTFSAREDKVHPPVLRIGTGSTCTTESNAAFCSRLGKDCGAVSGTDNCGLARSVASCGTCTAPETCGGAGTANVCGSAPSGWTLAWSDEFDGPNGSAPDSTKWVYDIGWGDGGWGNNELEYYTSGRDNSFLQGGSLVIEARTDDLQPSMVCGSSPCNYTSARMKTLGTFSQQYGRFEARIKIPTGSGMWPAFWMMGTDFPTVDWPACGEIDVMENWGSDGTVIAGTTHDPGANSENGISGEYTFSSLTTVANDYHVYAIEWDVNAVKFFVDTTEYHCVRKPSAPSSSCGAISGTVANAPHTWPFDKPFFMLLNLAIDSSSDNRPNSSTKFPAQMLVDYVRVYKAQ
jgi:beta-glucanase (GH16 family)